jgi:hypothetical protein
MPLIVDQAGQTTLGDAGSNAGSACSNVSGQSDSKKRKESPDTKSNCNEKNEEKRNEGWNNQSWDTSGGEKGEKSGWNVEAGNNQGSGEWD